MSLKKLHRLAKQIVALTDEDFKAATDDAEHQAHYVHPLKMGTAARVQRAGHHNLLVIRKLKELRATILAGA